MSKVLVILKNSEKEVISHMNDHHKNSIDLYIKKLLKEQLTEKKGAWLEHCWN